MPIRPATEADAGAIAAIWAQGIGERAATFQTRNPEMAELEELIAAGTPFLVAERDGAVVGFAKLGRYDDSAAYYAGVREATLYVERDARRAGIGRALLEGLVVAAEELGAWQLIAKIFTTNEQSVALFRSSGFRPVGTHLRHGRLDGEWKDVLVLERLIGPAAEDDEQAV